MTTTTVTSSTISGNSPTRRALRILLRQRGAQAGLAMILVLLILVLAAPLLTSVQPNKINPSATLQPPSLAHPMGTDNLGRDIWTRFLFGGRISLLVGLIAVVIGGITGTALGILAGFYGRWVDALLSWFIDVLLAFPGILLALVIVTILGPGLTNVMVAVGIAFTPSFMRVARGSVLATRELEYIEAAYALGSSDLSIMLRHILPNIMRPLLVLATLGTGTAILEGAALSFLGLGAQPPSPEWGAMLNAGQNFLRQGWWMAVFPGLGIFTVVLAVNLFGDGLGDAISGDARTQLKETEHG
jgi:peptide/nickel transport system permease protein